MLVQFDDQIHEPVPPPLFRLSLEAVDGTLVWGSNTQMAGVEWALAPRGRLRFVVERTMLRPGTYSLNVSAHDSPGTHMHDFRRHCHRVVVTRGEVHESLGYLSLAGRWSAAEPRG